MHSDETFYRLPEVPHTCCGRIAVELRLLAASWPRHAPRSDKGSRLDWRVID